MPTFAHLEAQTVISYTWKCDLNIATVTLDIMISRTLPHTLFSSKYIIEGKCEEPYIFLHSRV